MRIRRFEAPDATRLCEIFFRSIHEVASRVYTPEQCAAWAPAIPDHQRWFASLSEYATYVAEDGDGSIVAWIAMTPAGYVDMLFALPEAVGRGIASALYHAVEAQAREAGLTRLTVHASVLAQPFFLKHGWTVDRHEIVVRNGVELPRTEMSRTLGLRTP